MEQERKSGRRQEGGSDGRIDAKLFIAGRHILSRQPPLHHGVVAHPATPKGAVIWSEGDVPKCTSAAGDDLLDPAWSLVPRVEVAIASEIQLYPLTEVALQLVD